MSAVADSLDRDAREWVDIACSANGSVWCWTQWERCESRPLVQTWARCCEFRPNVCAPGRGER